MIPQQPEDTLSLQTRELKMLNVSTLPLTTGLKLQKPFQIIEDDGSEVCEKEVRLDVDQEYILRVQFDPAYKDDLHIRTIDEILHITYREHPHIVSVNCCQNADMSGYILPERKLIGRDCLWV